VPERVHQVGDAAAGFGAEPDRPAAEEVARQHLPGECPGRPLEPHQGARLQLLAGVHQRRPGLGLAVLRAVVTGEQQALHRAAARHAVPEQPRREHARVVHDEQIAGPEEARKLLDGRVLDRAGRSPQDQEPRRAARRGVLRDELFGQIEIELGDEHDAIVRRVGGGRPAPAGPVRARPPAPRRAAGS
jgi:hypothetical protein